MRSQAFSLRLDNSAAISSIIPPRRAEKHTMYSMPDCDPARFQPNSEERPQGSGHRPTNCGHVYLWTNGPVAVRGYGKRMSSVFCTRPTTRWRNSTKCDRSSMSRQHEPYQLVGTYSPFSLKYGRNSLGKSLLSMCLTMHFMRDSHL